MTTRGPRSWMDAQDGPMPAAIRAQNLKREGPSLLFFPAQAGSTDGALKRTNAPTGRVREGNSSIFRRYGFASAGKSRIAPSLVSLIATFPMANGYPFRELSKMASLVGLPKAPIGPRHMAAERRQEVRRPHRVPHTLGRAACWPSRGRNTAIDIATRKRRMGSSVMFLIGFDASDCHWTENFAIKHKDQTGRYGPQCRIILRASLSARLRLRLGRGEYDGSGSTTSGCSGCSSQFYGAYFDEGGGVPARCPRDADPDQVSARGPDAVRQYKLHCRRRMEPRRPSAGAPGTRSTRQRRGAGGGVCEALRGTPVERREVNQ